MSKSSVMPCKDAAMRGVPRSRGAPSLFDGSDDEKDSVSSRRIAPTKSLRRRNLVLSRTALSLPLLLLLLLLRGVLWLAPFLGEGKPPSRGLTVPGLQLAVLLLLLLLLPCGSRNGWSLLLAAPSLPSPVAPPPSCEKLERIR